VGHREAISRADTTASCQGCHAAGGAPGRMNVAAAQPALCLQCHASSSETHLTETVDCSLCHVPLPEAAGIATARVARFPRPPWHDAPDFVSSHLPDSPLRQLSCGVCHARETCERCHVNADRLPQVTALARDERVAALEEGRQPEYPLPTSHLERGWAQLHGASAHAEASTCGNCHTRPSCTGCHLQPSGKAAPVIASLPAPNPPGAPGVTLDPATARIHPADFGPRHASFSATGALQCAECHSQQYCAACHSGSDSRAFHPQNFLVRHSADVFAGQADCQSCHSTENFCRACHSGAGLGSQGRMNAAFHTGQPLWILGHGPAARMGLDSCASCHRQSDCVQCHSAAGGWGVNPHGPGFPGNRMAARSQESCRACHLNDPRGRN
jgi:predicted CXXCH cytochrome family protein